MRGYGLLFILILACLPACKRTYVLHYRTTDDLNAPVQHSGQPVLLGLYMLDTLPEGLETAGCEDFSTPTATTEFLGSSSFREERPVSLVPGETSSVRLNRSASAHWLLLVPYFDQKCEVRADLWGLVRLRKTTRHRSVQVSSYQLSFPWESRPWRQRGCASGEASHVLWTVCE